MAASQETRAYGDEELLLSYRREADSSVAKPAPAHPGQPNDQQTSEIASNPGAPREANPLRNAAEAIPAYVFPDAKPATDAEAPAAALTAEGIAAPLATPPIGSQVTPTPDAGPLTSPPAAAAEPNRYGDLQSPLDATPASMPGAVTETAPAPAAEALPVDPSFHFDPAVAPSAAETPEAKSEAQEPAIAPPSPGASPLATEDFRRLAPRSDSAAQATGPAGEHGRSFLPGAFSQLQSLSTAGAGLAVVVGLFFVCMWLLRRSSGAKPTGTLPNEAFAVLGRAPLTPNSFAHLLRVGNKLVLVAVTPDGIQPLTEVVDPIEVDRLTGVCASGRGHGPAAEFQQVLAQLAREPARGFLGGEAVAGGGRRRA